MDKRYDEFRQHTEHLVHTFFAEKISLESYIEESMERLLYCCSHSKNKYYNENGSVKISHLHTSQYAMFLYYMSNTLFRHDESHIATLIYYLNKIMHSVDWYYEIELPDYFIAEHPMGSVLGRAKYQSGFSFNQGVTVGGNKGKYPTFGKYVALYANSSVIGECHIGDHVFIGAGALVKDIDIPSYSIVFGQSPNLTIKQMTKEYMEERINKNWK